jgi:hypothetical protein
MTGNKKIGDIVPSCIISYTIMSCPLTVYIHAKSMVKVLYGKAI